MTKKLTLICLFLLAIVRVNAQQTICYHFYKYVDPVTNISHTMDRYFYFHFQDVYSYWTLERDEEHEGTFLYRYEKTTSDNCDYYVHGFMGMRPRNTYKGKHYSEYGYSFEDGFTVLMGSGTTHEYFLISKDKSAINWCHDIMEKGGTMKKGVITVGERVSAPPQQPAKPSMIK